MKNFKFWEKEILEAVGGDDPSGLALVNGKPVKCTGTPCGSCDFNNKECGEHISIKWLYEEHVEHVEQPKINSRTKKFFETIQTGWVARDENGSLYLYGTEPVKKSCEWSCSTFVSKLERGLFNFLTLGFIKWEDEEPWAVEYILKLDVCDEVEA